MKKVILLFVLIFLLSACNKINIYLPKDDINVKIKDEKEDESLSGLKGRVSDFNNPLKEGELGVLNKYNAHTKGLSSIDFKLEKITLIQEDKEKDSYTYEASFQVDFGNFLTQLPQSSSFLIRIKDNENKLLFYDEKRSDNLVIVFKEDLRTSDIGNFKIRYSVGEKYKNHYLELGDKAKFAYIKVEK